VRVFGLGFGEILILIIVGIVVVGPRNLPTLMRTAGRWVTKIRRMSTDLRSQSGIDDLIRQEGLEREIQEIRALSRVNVIDTLMAPGIAAAAAPKPATPAAPPAPAPAPLPAATEPAAAALSASSTSAAIAPPDMALREREYPIIGCDAYGALADDAIALPTGTGTSDGEGVGAANEATS
jgi:sec-independent protein translocase protein TatB